VVAVGSGPDRGAVSPADDAAKVRLDKKIKIVSRHPLHGDRSPTKQASN
jgi:hypothetical protein